jgi:chemotaxis protein CheZ
MITEREIIDELTKSVTQSVSELVKESLSEIVQQELSKAFTRALFEGEFYRGVSSEVAVGIGNIVAEISSFKKTLAATSSQESVGLLDGSASVLDDIISSTELATLKILDSLDQMQLVLDEAKQASNGDGSSGKFPFEGMETLIMKIMTELSFQDLTGQQIKMVINSLKRVEDLVFDVHLTAEALKKTKEKSPDKNLEQLKEEAKELVRDFKKNSDIVDQSEIDSLFEQYGL